MVDTSCVCILLHQLQDYLPTMVFVACLPNITQKIYLTRTATEAHAGVQRIGKSTR